MKIELKSIKFYPSMSEETNCFQATLYIDGKKVASVKNDGRGGNTMYTALTKESYNVLTEAEKYCLTLEPISFQNQNLNFKIDSTLENYIDRIFDDYITAKEIAKFNKKLTKDMDNNVLIGIPNQSYYKYKFNKSISDILKNPKTLETFKQILINNIKPKIEGDMKILNTNIPKEIIELI